jgi:hypothetical protein
MMFSRGCARLAVRAAAGVSQAAASESSPQSYVERIGRAGGGSATRCDNHWFSADERRSILALARPSRNEFYQIGLWSQIFSLPNLAPILPSFECGSASFPVSGMQRR